MQIQGEGGLRGYPFFSRGQGTAGEPHRPSYVIVESDPPPPPLNLQPSISSTPEIPLDALKHFPEGSKLLSDPL